MSRRPPYEESFEVAKRRRLQEAYPGTLSLPDGHPPALPGNYPSHVADQPSRRAAGAGGLYANDPALRSASDPSMYPPQRGDARGYSMHQMSPYRSALSGFPPYYPWSYPSSRAPFPGYDVPPPSLYSMYPQYPLEDGPRYPLPPSGSRPAAGSRDNHGMDSLGVYPPAAYPGPWLRRPDVEGLDPSSSISLEKKQRGGKGSRKRQSDQDKELSIFSARDVRTMAVFVVNWCIHHGWFPKFGDDAEHLLVNLTEKDIQKAEKLNFALARDLEMWKKHLKGLKTQSVYIPKSDSRDSPLQSLRTLLNTKISEHWSHKSKALLRTLGSFGVMCRKHLDDDTVKEAIAQWAGSSVDKVRDGVFSLGFWRLNKKATDANLRAELAAARKEQKGAGGDGHQLARDRWIEEVKKLHTELFPDSKPKEEASEPDDKKEDNTENVVVDSQGEDRSASRRDNDEDTNTATTEAVTPNDNVAK